MPPTRAPVGRMPVRPLVHAGISLGLGLGALADGILLHQVLRWHHLVSSTRDPAQPGNLELNLLADGLFHVAAFALTAFGVFLLWRAWHLVDRAGSGRVLAGSILGGAGAFHVLDGLVNHWILGTHHVHPSGAFVWDVALFALGLALLGLGWALARGAVPGAEERRRTGRPT